MSPSEQPDAVGTVIIDIFPIRKLRHRAMKVAQLEYRAGFEATWSPMPGSYNALTRKMVLVPPPPPGQVGVRPRPGNEVFDFQSLSDWWGRESKGAKPTRARENKGLCLG